MSGQRVLLERDGPLAIVRFHDPSVMNALDEPLCVEWAAVIGGLLDDEGVRAILLTGDGDAFCSGANLKSMSRQQGEGAAPDVSGMLRDALNPVLERMTASGKPIVAAVNGAAVGVGCGIALAADIVLVGRSGYFFQSFIRLGVVPDGGSTWTIPRLAGAGRAAAMMMLGEKIDAETAVAWGLAYRLYEDAALYPAALALAQKLANGPTLAYGRIKRMLAASRDNSFAAQMELEAEEQVASFATADCREGIAAFVEKRDARFSGR